MESNLKAGDSFAGAQGTQPGRGRPLSSESRNVAEDIILAAERCLKSKGPQEITTKEIAAMAGTRAAMVYYYFGSKDGLLAEVIRRGTDGMLVGFKKTGDAIRKGKLTNPTRALIAQFADCYNQHPAMCRILVSEMLRQDLPTHSLFLGQWPAPAKSIVTDAINHLSAIGYYRKDVDTEGIITMIRSVVFFPLIVKPYIVPTRESQGHSLDDQWIDFVTTVFESYLRPPK